MTFTLTQQIEALKMVVIEKRNAKGTGEVDLADALQAALNTLVATAATAGRVFPAAEQGDAAPVSATLYKQFEAEYRAFCEREAGLPARMDGGQGRALNEIVAYLRANCQGRDDAGALASWKYVLGHWAKLTPFLQRQKALTALNKYLVEILELIRKANQPAARTWPDHFNQAFAAKLSPDELNAYRAYLRGLGWRWDGQRQRWLAPA